MEPLGENFNLIGSPASMSDVSDGVNGNPVSPSGRNAQRHTPSILDRVSANINGQHRASFGPLEGETLVCVQCSEDPDLSNIFLVAFLLHIGSCRNGGWLLVLLGRSLDLNFGYIVSILAVEISRGFFLSKRNCSGPLKAMMLRLCDEMLMWDLPHLSFG
ncbi:hypothetical protein Nepgr_027284 [Nepenthes gracilis]|uniref:Uncharacterized protein n=1 Tax=Nepenthes gracilis TaxID=150966 RepID=A0AAD3Y3E2_NEPGR|nr:hypothetical protein Nepgr_027284 [Nepenthes gracilis]